MKLTPIKDQTPKIVWKEEEKTLTLTGEPVLELKLSWPQGEGKGKLVRAVDRHYARLAECWRRQWEREVYLRACAALALRRERSRPFTPWRGELSGEVKLDDGTFLSIAMAAREVHGNGRVLEYRWGDTWRWADGSVVTLSALFAGEKRWRSRLRRELDQAAGRSRQEGVCLDEDISRPLRRYFSPGRFALTEDCLELYYPQCTLAPAVEGAPVLRLPLPGGGKEGTKQV